MLTNANAKKSKHRINQTQADRISILKQMFKEAFCQS